MHRRSTCRQVHRSTQVSEHPGSIRCRAIRTFSAGRKSGPGRTARHPSTSEPFSRRYPAAFAHLPNGFVRGVSCAAPGGPAHKAQPCGMRCKTFRDPARILARSSGRFLYFFHSSVLPETCANAFAARKTGQAMIAARRRFRIDLIPLHCHEEQPDDAIRTGGITRHRGQVRSD